MSNTEFAQRIHPDATLRCSAERVCSSGSIAGASAARSIQLKAAGVVPFALPRPHRTDTARVPGGAGGGGDRSDASMMRGSLHPEGCSRHRGTRRLGCFQLTNLHL